MKYIIKFWICIIEMSNFDLNCLLSNNSTPGFNDSMIKLGHFEFQNKNV